jgi:hypothetical protein
VHAARREAGIAVDFLREEALELAFASKFPSNATNG